MASVLDRRGLAVHALGPPRRARGVEHLGADHRVVDVGALLVGDDGVVHLEAGQIAARVDLDQARPARLGGDGDLVAELARADERLGLAVLDDVRGLLAGQVPVDRREAQPGALGGIEDLDEFGPVRAHQRDGVTGLQATGPQGPGQAVDLRVEVGVGAVPVGRDEREAVRDPGRPPRVQHALGRRGTLVLGDRQSPPSRPDLEGRKRAQLPAVAERLPGHGHGHAAVDLVGRAADDVGHHAHPLLKVYQGDAVGLTTREDGAGESGRCSTTAACTVALPLASRHSSAAGDRAPLRTRGRRPRVEDPPVAGRAPLDEEPALPGGLPERPALGADRRFEAGRRPPAAPRRGFAPVTASPRSRGRRST